MASNSKSGVKIDDGYTKIANYFLDHVMPRVSPAEWKVICTVLRLTVGWRREEAEVTLDRFTTLTGLAREAVVAAIKKACRRAVIERRIQQVGRQRTFRFRAVLHANLKALSEPDPRRHQEARPFEPETELTEFDYRTSNPVENAGLERVRSSEIELSWSSAENPPSHNCVERLMSGEY